MLIVNFYRVINFRSTLRNYGSVDTSIKGKNNEEFNFNTKQAKTFTKNLNNFSDTKMPGIKTSVISPPATANPRDMKFSKENLDFSHKEQLKTFFVNKSKVNLRLNTMYKDSINNFNMINSNNSVGQRVLIKNTRGGNVEDRFCKTTKIFY